MLIRRRWALAAAGILVIVLLVTVYRHVLVRGVLTTVAGFVTGTHIALRDMTLTQDHATLIGLDVQRAGLPLLSADRVDVSYDLRALLPGGFPRFGLHAVSLQRPVLTLYRYADGSFNIGGGPQPVKPTPPLKPAAPGVPLVMRASVVRGEVILRDASRLYLDAHELKVGGIDASGTIDSAAITRYNMGAAYLSDGKRYPFTVKGIVDARTGLALHRLRVAALPLHGLVNYLINARAAHLDAGVVRDADATFYDGTHFAARARIDGVRLRMTGFAKPLRDTNGIVDARDGMVVTRDLRASVAGVPITITGGMYDFANPQLRLVADAIGPFGKLRHAFTFSARQPIEGDANIRTLVEGSVSNPLILSRIDVPHMRFGTYPIEATRGTVAYYKNAAVLAPVSARYGGISVRADGAFLIAKHLTTQVIARADADANDVPYAAQLIPGSHLHFTGELDGWESQFRSRGVLNAIGGGVTLAVPFELDPRGDGAFGPIALHRADGSSLEGTFYLDRARSDSAFWASARGLTFATVSRIAQLPGLAKFSPPAFTGRLEGDVAGVGPPSNFILSGKTTMRDMRVGALEIARADGNIYGRMTDVRLRDVKAAGGWGRFDGVGSYDGARLALRGTYRGSYDALRAFTGDIGATGPLEAPASVVVAGGQTTVQTTDARSAGGSIRGVPVSGFDLTLSTKGPSVRLDAGTADVAGGSLAAAGDFGRGGQVGISLTGAHADRLARTGLPITTGVLSAIGAASFGAAGFRFSGGAVVTGGRAQGLPVAANADLALDGPVLRLEQVQGRVGPTPVQADGRLTGIGSPAVHYDLHVAVRAADVAPVVHEFARVPVPLSGSADADLHLGGSGASPELSGFVTLPQATVNGLDAEDGTGFLSVRPGEISLLDGRVTVGSTVTQVAAGMTRESRSVSVSSMHANLSDFDNFFDPGDLLAGRGSLALSFERDQSSQRVRTSGRIRLRGMRYDHYRLGDGSADWLSSSALLSGHTGFRGPLGALALSGAIVLPKRAPLRGLLTKANYDVRVHAEALDVNAWLLALGYDRPIAGHVDANGTIRGRLPQLALSGNAALSGGRYGKLPIDRLSLTAASTFERATISDAELAVGSITARGSGSFGFAPKAPLRFAIHGSSPDIGAVVAKLTGNRLPVKGAFESDVRVAGTFAKPSLTGGFDIENGGYGGVLLPRTLGSFETNGRNVQLRDAEMQFATGTLYLAGSLPLTVSPLAFGPASAPVALELGAQNIGLESLRPLLPDGSAVKGTLNGRVAVGGTAGHPSLSGTLQLVDGLLATPFEVEPIRNAAAELTFSHTEARLVKLHAEAGGGTIDSAGSLVFGDLVQPGTTGTLDLTTTVRGAKLNFPAYGRGQIDGRLRLSHAPNTLAKLAGDVTLSDATIPFAALYAPAAGGNGNAFELPGAAPKIPFGLPNTTLALGLSAGRNVRVRSSVIDIGAAGTLHVSGTLASPVLAGGFDSTGGTLTYFNTVFRLQQAAVTFEPDLGLVPSLDAQATTHSINPDPDLQRNLTGSADITLSVTGPVTNLNIALSSNPSYDRQQILGLLLSAPAIGATNLFGTQPGPLGPGQAPQPGLPPGVTVPTNSGGVTVAQEAFGIVNAQFTRNLLAPLETAFGGALGLSSVNVTFDYTGAVGLTARKILGKQINAVYGQSFGYPYRQSFGFEIRPSANTAAQLTFFQTYGATTVLTPVVAGSQVREFAAQPQEGQSGFAFSLERFFK